MLAGSARRIADELPTQALVLDAGGGASPFARADWVIDLLSYEQRGLYGSPPDPSRERFSAATWVTRDICDREPWPFADRQFDFSVCSHTLEDVRDPIFVCRELERVSRAGYIEVPSRLEEQSYGVHGPWVGWSHHRWLVDVEEDSLTFVSKPHVLHARESDHFPAGFHEALTPEERVQRLWWQDRVVAREHVFLDAASLDAYLSEFVADHRPPARTTERRGLRDRLARSRLR